MLDGKVEEHHRVVGSASLLSVETFQTTELVFKVDRNFAQGERSCLSI